MPPRRTTARSGGHARSVSLIDENAPVASLVGPQRSKPIAGTATLTAKTHRVNSSAVSNAITSKEMASVINHKHSSSLGGVNSIGNRKVLGDVSNATKAVGGSKANVDGKSTMKTGKVRKVSSQTSLLANAPGPVGLGTAARAGASATVGGNVGRRLATTLRTRSSAQDLGPNTHVVAHNNKRKPVAKTISACGVGHSWANACSKEEMEDFEVLADGEENDVISEEMETEQEEIAPGPISVHQEADDKLTEGPDPNLFVGHDEGMVIDGEESVSRVDVHQSAEAEAQTKLDPAFLDPRGDGHHAELLLSETQPVLRMESDENELSLCPNNVDDRTNEPHDSANWLLLNPEEEEECRVLIETIKRDFQEELDFWDTTMVAEYSEEIFKYMEELEESTLPNPRYMDSQTEIEWDMRTTLIDWLLQVHMRYHMLPETLWIAVNIIDRFLSKRVVSLVKFQLVGVTAMFVAAKYEEIMAPSVEEFVYMTENGYTREEILKGEKILLTTLEFKISPYCSPYSWLRRISKADDYDIQTRTLSKFLMELTLLDHRFLRAKSSMIAAIGMYTARKMLGGDWSDAFVFYSGYSEAQLITPMSFLIEFLTTEGFESRFVYKKYANRKFLKASVFARNQALKKVREEEESCHHEEH